MYISNLVSIVTTKEWLVFLEPLLTCNLYYFLWDPLSWFVNLSVSFVLIRLKELVCFFFFFMNVLVHRLLFYLTEAKMAEEGPIRLDESVHRAPQLVAPQTNVMTSLMQSGKNISCLRRKSEVMG